METTHVINNESIGIEDIQDIILLNKKLILSEASIEKIKKCRTYLDDKMKTHKEPIYGINTGFGSLCNVKISGDNLQLLQENLVMSHACGTGEEVSEEIVKLMLFL